ncbi:hypothetical protein [Cryptosporangium sp. NPDC048952]
MTRRSIAAKRAAARLATQENYRGRHRAHASGSSLESFVLLSPQWWLR